MTDLRPTIHDTLRLVRRLWTTSILRAAREPGWSGTHLHWDNIVLALEVAIENEEKNNGTRTP